MVWQLIAFGAAFFRALRDVFNKQGLEDANTYVVAWALRFLTVPFLVPILLVAGMPVIAASFWGALLVGGLLNVVATLLYVKAIAEGDLSIVVPIMAFTPAFLLVTSPLILGEFAGPLGILGILLVAGGAYLLHLEKRDGGYLAPLRALFDDGGAKYMLAVAFIYSIAANIDKIGVTASSPFLWTLATHAFIGVALLGVALVKTKRAEIADIAWMPLISMGFVNAIAITFQMVAITLTIVPYVIAIKRTSMVMSVLFGHFLFGEKHLRARLSGAIVMVAGAILILFAV